jgi:hypothetical protein
MYNQRFLKDDWGPVDEELTIEINEFGQLAKK